MRQFSDVPCAQEGAQAVGAQQAFDELLRAHDLSPDDLLWYAPIFEVRYKSIAARLRASGIEQVLERASGLSLRGLAMTQADPALTYIDTDLPALTAEKEALVGRLRAQHRLSDGGRYLLRAANAVELDELWAATELLKRDRPLAIVSEGLLQNLSPVELDVVAGSIRSVLEAFAPGGVWMTSDFSFRGRGAAPAGRRRRGRAGGGAAAGRPRDD